VDDYKNGVELTSKQLLSVFEKFNIAEVNPVGEKFDPNKHQAISAIEAEGEPNTVHSVLQKGYTLNDRVLRPALVMVIKGKE
jgi:molecular chaperone GrpE